MDAPGLEVSVRGHERNSKCCSGQGRVIEEAVDLVPPVEGLLARALQDPCPDTSEKGLMALVSGEDNKECVEGIFVYCVGIGF